MEVEQVEIEEGGQKEELGGTGQQHSAQGFSKRGEEEHASTLAHVDGVVDVVVVEVGGMV